MKQNFSSAAALFSLFLLGCSDPNRLGVTSTTQPGPVAGRAIGGAVGVVGGNVAGGVVGVGEGVVAGAKKPFDNKTTVVRRWKTVVTADGRTIQVPEDIVVNENGK